MLDKPGPTVPTYYDILRLPAKNVVPDLRRQDVKAAYHRALLLNHPDKIQRPAVIPTNAGTSETRFTIVQITTAYTTLSDPKQRAAYDRQLDQDRWKSREEIAPKTIHGGVETYDLDDLSFDESGQFWYRNCRCGDERGYKVTHADLDTEEDYGEIHMGCKGCSLWIKVLFGAVAESEGAA